MRLGLALILGVLPCVGFAAEEAGDSGSSSATEAPDTCSASATVVFTGTAASTEGTDSSAISGTKRDPRDIGSGLKAWGASAGLAADRSSWTDYSGQSNTLDTASSTKASSTTSPAGLAAAKFVKASSTYLVKHATNLLGTNAYTAFMVVRVDADTDQQALLVNDDLAQTIGGIEIRTRTTTKWNVSHDGTSSASTSTGYSDGTWYRIIVRRAAGANPIVTINGVDDTNPSGLTASVVPSPSASTMSLGLGARWVSGTTAQLFSDCSIAEWGWYDNALSSGDVATLDSFLSNKHGV